MNKIINKFLLTADKFMPEPHLKVLKVDPYSASGPFTRHIDRINKFIKTGDTDYMHKNELNKACGRRGRASLVYKFFDEKTEGSGVKSMQQNEQLAEELHKPIIRKF